MTAIESPNAARMSRSRAALAVVLVVVGLAALVVGLWFIAWELAVAAGGLTLLLIGLAAIDVEDRARR